MEAAEALGRGSLSSLLEAARESVRARSRTFWIVAGLTALAAALRFATLGVQAYHHDEIVTASRVLRDGFWHAMDAVGFSESAPPLYYALALGLDAGDRDRASSACARSPRWPAWRRSRSPTCSGAELTRAPRRHRSPRRSSRSTRCSSGTRRRRAATRCSSC